jgi:glycosyltransferase involved in cell wall biosynthesis
MYAKLQLEAFKATWLSQAVVFTRHYTNSPQCVPSRTSMVTGRYVHETGTTNNGEGLARSTKTGQLDSSCVAQWGAPTCAAFAARQSTNYTFLDLLAAAGYEVSEAADGAQALVLASLWEGFGLPALEAMACGTPVVAARAGALPEVVGDAGLLVDPRCIDALSAALDQVLRQPALAAELAAAGPRRAAGFDWRTSANQVLEVLRECG